MSDEDNQDNQPLVTSGLGHPMDRHKVSMADLRTRTLVWRTYLGALKLRDSDGLGSEIWDFSMDASEMLALNVPEEACTDCLQSCCYTIEHFAGDSTGIAYRVWSRLLYSSIDHMR